jgi:hypothetical protein
MKEMNNASNLVFGHIWCQHKTPQTESVEEKFDSVRLDNVAAKYDCLSLDNGQLDKTEQQHKLVQVTVAHSVKMVDSFKSRRSLMHVMIQLYH